MAAAGRKTGRLRDRRLNEPGPAAESAWLRYQPQIDDGTGRRERHGCGTSRRLMTAPAAESGMAAAPAAD